MHTPRPVLCTRDSTRRGQGECARVLGSLWLQHDILGLSTSMVVTATTAQQAPQSPCPMHGSSISQEMKAKTHWLHAEHVWALERVALQNICTLSHTQTIRS